MDPKVQQSTTKKKMPTWAKVIIVVISVIILAIGGLLIATTLILKNNDKEVQSFLSSIYSSDYNKAYGNFSSQLKEVQDQDSFESAIESVKKAGLNSDCKTNWTTNSVASSTDKASTKEIGGIIECSNSKFDASFKLVDQNGDYKLYEYSIRVQ